MIINSGNLQTLNISFNAAFSSGFDQAPADHEAITMMVNSMTATEEYGWLGTFPGLREWVGERVLRGIKTHDYSIKNRKFESSIEVDRDDIEDDNLGLYSPMFTEMGRAAAAHPCELVYAALKLGFATECYDGQYFFDTDHPVPGVGNGSVSNVAGNPSASTTNWYLFDGTRAIKPMIHQVRRAYDMKHMDDPLDEHVFMNDKFRYGVDGRANVGYGLWQLAFASNQSLTEANYASAREAMMALKAPVSNEGDEPRPLGIKPTHLVVPPSLEGEALKLIKRELVPDGANAGGNTNVYQNTVEVIATPWLA